MNTTKIRRVITFTAGVAIGLNLLTGAAYAEPKGNSGGGNGGSSANAPGRQEVRQEQSSAKSEPKQEQQSGGGSSMGTKYDCNETPDNGGGKGANDGGGYQSTCDPNDFGGNGQESGPGKQTGKPCAGCVGNADDKNPPGQAPDGSDSNSGYECDGRDRPSQNQKGNGNQGVGDENPAHTGCQNQNPPKPPTCPDGSPMPPSGKCGGTPPKTCPDGSPMPANGNCNGGSNGGSGQTKTCPDGRPMPAQGGCGNGNGNNPQCPDGSSMPANGVCIQGTTVVNNPVPNAPALTPEVLGTTIANPVATPAAPRRNDTAAVLSDTRKVTDLPAPAAVSPKGERVQVLGMTPSRGASSLARTGAGFGPLVMVAAALLAMGVALVRVRRRPTIG